MEDPNQVASIQIERLFGAPGVKAFNFLKPALMVQTERALVLDIWYLGLLHRAIQIGAFVYVILSFVAGNAWAMHEVPQPSINSYALPSNEYTLASKAFLEGTATPPYCSNASYQYSSSPNPEWFWQYTAPDCEALDWQEVFEKDPLGSIFITTAFIEETIFGWPCAEGLTTAATDAGCAGAESASGDVKGSVTLETIGKQCICKIKRTVTPVGSEELKLGFGHAYKSALYGGLVGSNQDSQGGTFNTDTESPSPIGLPLDTRILFDNFTDISKPWRADADASTYKEYKGGSSLTSFTIKEWLIAGGVDLDTPNMNIGADHADASRRINTRFSGVMLNIDLSYTNTDKVSGQATSAPHVHAVIRVDASTKTYAGPGPQVHWEMYPRGPATEQTYHKVTRYRQGIIASFNAGSSKIYAFDFNYLITTLTSALVLLGLAGTVTRFVAFYFLGGLSNLIKHAAAEPLSKSDVLTQIGTRLVLSALNFDKMDDNNSGTIGHEELVKVLAKTDSMDFDTAYATAHYLMHHADKAGNRTLDFKEYFTAQEVLLTFEQYVKSMPKIKRMKDYGKLKKAWDDVVEGEMFQKKKIKKKARKESILAREESIYDMDGIIVNSGD